MTRAQEEAARLERLANNVPKVSYSTRTKWSFACPQPHGTWYPDYPTPEAVYVGWKDHCKHQHPGLPVGWPVGVKGKPVDKQDPSAAATVPARRAGRAGRKAGAGQESLF